MAVPQRFGTGFAFSAAAIFLHVRNYPMTSAAGDFPFHSILVPTDFSEPAAAALGRAVALAEKTAAKITVAHVVPDAAIAGAVPGTSFAGHWRIPPADLEHAQAKLVATAQERLQHWMVAFQKLAPQIQTTVLVGTPFVEVIRQVQRDGHDLVLAGTRGLGVIGRLLVGSTAERLVRKCPCPVWIVHPEHEWPLRSILVGVDLTPVSGQCLRLAGALARHMNCAVTALYAFNFPAAPVVPATVMAPPEDMHASRRAARKTAARDLSDFVKEHATEGVTIQQQLALGVPWRIIERVAKRIDAGLLVMGSVGRSNIPGLLIGNTAEKVLRHTDRSILAIKPEGFVSPVT